MNGTGLSESALKQEIDDFRRQIEATRSRLVLNTVRADTEFSKAVYGFRSLLNDLHTGFSFPVGMNAREGFSAAVYALGRRALGIYSPDDPVGAAALEKIENVFPVTKFPGTAFDKRRVTTQERNAARKTIGRFVEASKELAVAQLEQTGIDVNREDMDEWLDPLMRKLDIIPTLDRLREPYSLRRA